MTYWALAQSGLATAYRERIKGDRADNVEQAISHYQAALEVLSIKRHFEDWIRIQTSLASAYRERLKGNRSENLEFSLDLYQKVLPVLNREKDPVFWTTVQTNLATSYRERIQGSRAQNIEKAIGGYLQALEIYKQEEFPDKWANTLVRLAEAYRERIRGDRDDNLEQAIQCYLKALQVNSRTSSPFEWAEINFGLARVYLERLRGDRGKNVEQAIALLQQASEVYTRVAFPQQWATIQNNLGAAYLDRVRGERADNLEMAIHHFQRASEVYTQEASPEQWASTMTNLATVYQDHFRTGKSIDNEEAIRYYQRALEVYSREVYPEQWAAIQINLGNMHLERMVGERVENLQQAIYHFRRALDVFNREVAGERQASIVRQLKSAKLELTLIKFFQLWSRNDAPDKDRRIQQFSELLSELLDCPLREYQHLPEIEGYLAVFDMRAVFEGSQLPFSEEFPILFLTPRKLNESYRENIRQRLEKRIGPSNRRALLIPFCEAAKLTSVRDFVKGAIRQVHAYDLICLSQDEVRQITRSQEPNIIFRRIILSQVDLVSVNPYKQTGATSGRMFFGRERELQSICDQATSTNFVLVGGRRIGKTSILKQLEKVRLPSAGFNAYYHSCDETPTQFEMVQALTTNKFWFPKPPEQTPSTLVEVIKCLPDDKPTVVLFDEVDKLIRLDHSIFSILRALSNSDYCQFMLCGEQLLRGELTNPDSPLYNFGISMPIGRLDFHAVTELVTRPMKQLEIEIVGEEVVVQRIWDFTSGHPSIVQSLCRKVVEHVNERQPRTMTLDDIETVANQRDFLEKDFLNVYWERATVLERLCCLIMASADKTYTLTAMHNSLTNYDIKVTLNQVNDALERLIELRNILERIGTNYKFAVSVFPEVITRTGRLDDFIALYREKYQRKGDVVP